VSSGLNAAFTRCLSNWRCEEGWSDARVGRESSIAVTSVLRRSSARYRRLASSATTDAVHQALYREREQVGCKAGLSVRRDQFVGVLVGDDRGDTGDGHQGERGRDPDESVGHGNSSLGPTLHGQVIVVVADGEAFGERQRRDGLVTANQAGGVGGWVETIHAPLPSAAAC
jgi:hypothetical protein